MNEALASKWYSLRTSQDEYSDVVGIPTLPLDVSTANGEIRLALGDKDQSRLLVPIDMATHVPDDLETNGLQTSTITLTVGGKPVRFVDLMCLEKSLDDVFRGLTEDVVRRVMEGGGPLTSIEKAITEFRRLVGKSSQPSIQKERVVGLLGELCFLNSLLDLNSAASGAWLGSSGARHDFLNGQLAAEVKTSVRLQEPVVEIHAIDQLEPPSGGELYLVHYILEENPGGELSVPEQAEKALKQVTDRNDLEERLSKVDYDPDVTEPWEKYRFSQKGIMTYRVNDDFPRLITSSLGSGSLPAGVSHVRYRLNLNNAKQHLLSDSEQDEMIKSLSTWA